MEYSEFTRRFQKFSETSHTPWLWWLMFFMAFSLVVMLSVSLEQPYPVLLVIGTAVCILLLSHRERYHWRRANFRCQSCDGRLDRDAAAAVLETNRCPRCKGAAFSVGEVGQFVTVDPCEFRSPADGEARGGAGGNDTSNNPYAAPVAAQRDPLGFTVPLQWPQLWVTSLVKSFRVLCTSRARLLQQANAELAASGASKMDAGYETPYLRSVRRTAAWWILWALLLPAFFGAFAIQYTGLDNWYARGMALLSTLTAIGAGCMIYVLTLSLGPRAWRRWWMGNPPAMRPVQDDDTSFHGLQMFFLGADEQILRRPHIQFRYRAATPLEFRVGLLNTETAVEYQVPLCCDADDHWQEDRVNFAVLLEPLRSDFAGNRIRVILPQGGDFQLDDFLVTFPEMRS